MKENGTDGTSENRNCQCESVYYILMQLNICGHQKKRKVQIHAEIVH